MIPDFSPDKFRNDFSTKFNTTYLLNMILVSLHYSANLYQVQKPDTRIQGFGSKYPECFFANEKM